MSQVKFNSKFEGKDVEVMGGWDNPLKTYHLTVFDLTPDAEEETLWCAMDHFGFKFSLEQMRESLVKLGITPPNEEFFEICSRKEGNVVFRYDADASVWSMRYL